MRIVVAVAIVNFLSFWIISIASGGDALSGKVEGGKYYVAHRGNYTEVSQEFFYYSRVHTVSVFVTHALAIACGTWLYFHQKQADCP